MANTDLQSDKERIMDVPEDSTRVLEVLFSVTVNNNTNKAANIGTNNRNKYKTTKEKDKQIDSRC